MRYPSTEDTGLQDTQILEWSDLITLTLLTRRLAGERHTNAIMGKTGAWSDQYFIFSLQTPPQVC